MVQCTILIQPVGLRRENQATPTMSQILKATVCQLYGKKYYSVVLTAEGHPLDINNFGELSRTGRLFLWGLSEELAVICAYSVFIMEIGLPCGK